MRLETWDPVRKKYVFYRRADEHAHDCERHPYETIPRWVFLDTDVINLLVKFSEHVFHVGGRANRDLEGILQTLKGQARNAPKPTRISQWIA